MITKCERKNRFKLYEQGQIIKQNEKIKNLTEGSEASLSLLSLLGFFFDEFFFLGDFLRLDLKLPFRGSFTIQAGGTIIG